jgi:hypothetical protein
VREGSRTALEYLEDSAYQEGPPLDQQVDFRTCAELEQTEQWMQLGRGQRDSGKSACLKIFDMGEKYSSGREMQCEGLQRHGGVRIVAISYKQEKQGSVLTNQCLGKE